MWNLYKNTLKLNYLFRSDFALCKRNSLAAFRKGAYNFVFLMYSGSMLKIFAAICWKVSTYSGLGTESWIAEDYLRLYPSTECNSNIVLYALISRYLTLFFHGLEAISNLSRRSSMLAYFPKTKTALAFCTLCNLFSWYSDRGLKTVSQQSSFDMTKLSTCCFLNEGVAVFLR